MKKAFLLLPFMVSLTACGASENAPKDDAELAPGIIQPVSGSGASTGSYGWSSDVESAPMPASMTK